MSGYFSIKAGLIDYFRPFSAVILPTTSAFQLMSHHKIGGYYDVMADWQIFISAKTLARDNVDLQLGNVEREIMRLVCAYQNGDIEGITEMNYGGYERIYDTQDWAKSNWSSRTFIRTRYNHVNTP